MLSQTRNRDDLLAFLEVVDQGIPEGRSVIAIADNLSTRTTDEVEQWLQSHPRWSFQFTPTHASWMLNQIELYFSILQRRPLKHGAFTSEQDLAEQMLCFVETYNQTATPFQWTCSGKVLNAYTTNQPDGPLDALLTQPDPHPGVRGVSSSASAAGSC